MKQDEYKINYYPEDFILIGNEYYPLPKGGKLTVEVKEVGTTFTTADGTKRKDTIKKYKSVSIQFNILLQEGLDKIKEIIEKIETAGYETQKLLCIKKENMPVATGTVLSSFERIKIETVKPIKIGFKFRKNSLFVYNGVNLKIN